MLPSPSENAAFGDEQRLDVLTKAVAIAVAYGILTSFRLWAGPRTFPAVPLIPFLPPLLFPLDWLLLAVMIVALFAIFFSKRPTLPIVLLLACLGLEFVFDQNRLAPWMYQFFFMLAVIAVGRRSERRDGFGTAEALATCRVIVACMFLWSGLEKINARFFVDVVPWLLQPFADWLGGTAFPLTMALGVLIPLSETAIGVGLLTKRYRMAAAVAGMAFMAMLFAYFGPFGRAWNDIIWTWDLAMAVFLALLAKGEERPVRLRPLLSSPVPAVALLLFVVMPALGLFGLWDSMLSAALYSGNTKSAHIEISTGLKEKFPQSVSSLMRPIDSDRHKLDLYLWSASELSTPPYPETRVFEAVARAVCRHAERPEDLTLYVRERPETFSGRYKITQTHCGTP